MGKRFLAVDWGTTNLRAWVVGDDDRPLRAAALPLGIGGLQAGEAPRRFVDTVRPAVGGEGLPAILCGMVGSNLGWAPVPYVDCPAGPEDLAGRLQPVDGGGGAVVIVPGLRAERPDGGPDVMRGEETQIFGWAAGDPARRRGERLLCLPGTHAKWVRMVDGRIESLVTSMTGELFDLLGRYSVLRTAEGVEDDAAFELGLKAAGDGGALASRMFTARSRVVGGDMPADRARAYLSGLLIGAEAASMPALFGVAKGAPLTIIGDPALAARYRRALAAAGLEAEIVDGRQAALDGLTALAREGLFA